MSSSDSGAASITMSATASASSSAAASTSPALPASSRPFSTSRSSRLRDPASPRSSASLSGSCTSVRAPAAAASCAMPAPIVPAPRTPTIATIAHTPPPRQHLHRVTPAPTVPASAPNHAPAARDRALALPAWSSSSSRSSSRSDGSTPASSRRRSRPRSARAPRRRLVLAAASGRSAARAPAVDALGCRRPHLRAGERRRARRLGRSASSSSSRRPRSARSPCSRCHPPLVTARSAAARRARPRARPDGALAAVARAAARAARQLHLRLAERRQRVLLLIRYDGTSALMPVSARPMISFWICEVPS